MISESLSRNSTLTALNLEVMERNGNNKMGNQRDECDTNRKPY